ncbi:MAG: ISKra4-like element ISKra2 family transposase [Chloroflexota bacterium]
MPGELSPRLVEGLARCGVKVPFAQAAEDLRFFCGVWVSEDTARRQTEAVGAAYVAVQDAELARLEHDLPPPPHGPPIQQVSADGAMVPLVHGKWAEVKTLAVGTVTTVPGKDGPEVGTRDLTYFSRMTDAATFVRQARVELYQRGTQTADLVAMVCDGSVWLQAIPDTYRPDAVRILDFPHAAEYLTKAAQASWGSQPLLFHTWLAAQTHTLKHETPEPVLAALRLLPTDAAPDPVAAAEARDEALGYLAARLEQIQYADFQRRGLPIGSGAVESACKLVVEARLKGSGMHWDPDHVSPMVALRTVLCSHRWAEAWPKIQQELRRRAYVQRLARCLKRHTQPEPIPAVAPPPKRKVHLASAHRRMRAATHPRSSTVAPPTITLFANPSKALASRQ